jgi:hypothetical protein
MLEIFCDEVKRDCTPFFASSQHVHVPSLQQKGLASTEQEGCDPLHPEDAEEADEDCAASQLGGHSAISSQHFQLPLGQQMVLLAPHCGFVALLQTTFTELAALL